MSGQPSCSLGIGILRTPIAVAYRIDVPEISLPDSLQSLVDPGVCSAIPEISKPAQVLHCLNDINSVSCALSHMHLAGNRQIFKVRLIAALPQRVGQHLGEVAGAAPGAVLDLLAAGYAHHHHLPVGALGVDLREQGLLSDGHGDVIVLLFVAE